MNGGKCETTGSNSYICKCGDRYRGAKCEVDTDPCQERPCLNNGKWFCFSFLISIYTLSIGTSYLLTILVLKF